MLFARPTLPFALLLLLGGVAIKADELKIHNAEELIDFSNNVNGGTNYSGTTVYLDSDIDFTPSLSQQFQPIGNSSKFSNVAFDGQGHAINNLGLNSSSLYVGLFGFSTGGTIKNVVLDKTCSVTSYGSNTVSTGSISGYCMSCVIENIVNMADVSFAGSSSDLGFGGIVGNIMQSSAIRNCVNYGSVTHSGKSSGISNIGGIVGKRDGGWTRYIQNCANYGTITYNGTNTLYMGGILGYGNSGTATVENCVSAGRVVDLTQTNITKYIGNVVGYINSYVKTNITHCFWTSDVGYNDACGNSTTAVIVTNSTLKELNKETVDEMNEYAEKNSTWNKWLLNTNNSTVHFKVNDYKGFSTSNKLILLPSLAATGNNTFKGWFTDSGYSTSLPSYEVSEGMTLYGLYEAVVTVAFDGNGGTPSRQSKSVLFNKAYGALPEATRAGYSFGGWFTEKEEGKGERVTEEDIVGIGSDHTLYAQWSTNNYTITFIFNNGKENDVRTLNFNETIVYPENLTREGYIFNGWSPKPETMPAESITVATQWAINNYTITFIFNNGTDPEKRVFVFNETIVYPENLTREGFIFNGWSPKPERMPAEDITVTAQWIEVTKGTVEIVFDKKDLTEEEIREIIKEYTQEEFTIVKIETDEETGETKVIIKFVDKETADNFITTVKESSDYLKRIKKVDYVFSSPDSLSAYYCLSSILFVLF